MFTLTQMLKMSLTHKQGSQGIPYLAVQLLRMHLKLIPILTQNNLSTNILTNVLTYNSENLMHPTWQKAMLP